MGSEAEEVHTKLRRSEHKQRGRIDSFEQLHLCAGLDLLLRAFAQRESSQRHVCTMFYDRLS